jgi:pimeloyl-ACP methyl ester carboxylesterase
VVADAGDAIVVAFLGTKRPADHLVNLRLRHSPVFHPSKPSGSLDTAGSSSFADNPTSGSSSGGAAPAAHSGYLARAAAVPAEQLYRLARVQGKRLVLTGHSLGGAVATLCAVRLLDALPQELHHTVSCIGFAVPPVGNTALAEAAAVYGWEQRITNYTLPEDFVPGLMGMFGGQGEPQSPSSQADTSSSSAYAAAVAAAAAGGGHGGTIARTDHGKRL